MFMLGPSNLLAFSLTANMGAIEYSLMCGDIEAVTVLTLVCVDLQISGLVMAPPTVEHMKRPSAAMPSNDFNSWECFDAFGLRE